MVFLQYKLCLRSSQNLSLFCMKWMFYLRLPGFVFVVLCSNLPLVQVRWSNFLFGLFAFWSSWPFGWVRHFLKFPFWPRLSASWWTLPFCRVCYCSSLLSIRVCFLFEFVFYSVYKFAFCLILRLARMERGRLASLCSDERTGLFDLVYCKRFGFFII